MVIKNDARDNKSLPLHIRDTQLLIGSRFIVLCCYLPSSLFQKSFHLNCFLFSFQGVIGMLPTDSLWHGAGLSWGVMLEFLYQLVQSPKLEKLFQMHNMQDFSTQIFKIKETLLWTFCLEQLDLKQTFKFSNYWVIWLMHNTYSCTWVSTSICCKSVTSSSFPSSSWEEIAHSSSKCLTFCKKPKQNC